MNLLAKSLRSNFYFRSLMRAKNIAEHDLYNTLTKSGLFAFTQTRTLTNFFGMINLMSEYDKDLYFVAVKLLIRDRDKLLITHDIFGAWDLPGGRIKKDEFKASLPSVIERKMKEELGSEFKYSVGSPTVFFRVEREEHGLNNQKVRIFAVGYEALYEGGEVQLGDHHDKYEWVDIGTFKPEDYFVDGWLEGVQEYLDKQSS